jgi:hypothetical protein
MFHLYKKEEIQVLTVSFTFEMIPPYDSALLRGLSAFLHMLIDMQVCIFILLLFLSFLYKFMRIYSP